MKRLLFSTLGILTLTLVFNFSSVEVEALPGEGRPGSLVANTRFQCQDTDGDTICNHMDGFTYYYDNPDNDIPNDNECRWGGEELSSWTDESAVGEVSYNFDGIYTEEPGAGADAYDLDSDKDGLSDAVEAGDANPATPPVSFNGNMCKPDFRNPDRDGDGILDGADNCVNNANPDQENTYGDERGDACEEGAPGEEPGAPADSEGPTATDPTQPAAPTGDAGGPSTSQGIPTVGDGQEPPSALSPFSSDSVGAVQGGGCSLQSGGALNTLSLSLLALALTPLAMGLMLRRRSR